MIRLAHTNEQEALLRLANSTKMFSPDELEWLKAQITTFFKGELGSDLFWIVDDVEGNLLGGAHYGPDGSYEEAHFPDAQHVWNMYFVGVSPDAQGQGHGNMLLDWVEKEVKAKGGQRMIIETSSGLEFVPARQMYSKSGYTQHSCVKDAYGEGEDKIVLFKDY